MSNGDAEFRQMIARQVARPVTQTPAPLYRQDVSAPAAGPQAQESVPQTFETRAVESTVNATKPSVTPPSVSTPAFAAVGDFWRGKGMCATAARAIAGSLVVGIMLVVMRPEAVLNRPKRRDGKRSHYRDRTVNYGSVCILSTLTGILAICMFGG